MESTPRKPGPKAAVIPGITPGYPEMMTPGEVASYLRVNSKTVTRYAGRGLLRSVKTLGGHRRYYKDEVVALGERQASCRTP